MHHSGTEKVSGLVYCEAAAYSIPSIACNTGGVGTIVVHGDNGIMIEEEGWFELLCELCVDQDLYRKFSKSARNNYANRLNWASAAKAVETLIKN